jgi:hypothetical protein
MPSSTKKQAKFMAAAAHNPAFAKKVGISQDVAKEFNQADKGKKFGGGGMATKKLFGGKETYGEEKKEAQALKSGKISTKQYIAGEKSEGHKEENVAKQARDIKSGKMSPTAYAKSEQSEYACGGKVKKMAKGGSASARADGIATKGKTRGTIIGMKKGGKC